MNKLKNIISVFIYLTGLPFLIRELLQKNKATFILYHDISRRMFEMHINALKKRYLFVSLSEYLRAEKDRNYRLPKKALVITFDDGHANNYKLLPFIKENNIPVTFFLCSSIINTNRHFWFIEKFKNNSINELKKMEDEKRLEALKIEGFEENKEFNTRQALKKDEIEEMLNYADFQSHTKYHPILPLCKSNKAIEEISGSKTELEQNFGFKISSFSYPNGDYSDRDVELAKKAGYQTALTVDNGFNTPGDDPFRLKRICIDDNAGNFVMLLQVCGLWAFIKNIFTKKEYGCTDAIEG